MAELTPVFARGSGGYIQSIAFSPDGTLLAIGSSGPTVPVEVWEISSGKVVIRPDYPGPVYSVTFSPDGTKLAAGGDIEWNGNALVWEIPSGRLLTRIRHYENSDCPAISTVESVAFNPDGTQLATGAMNKTAQVWAMPSGRRLATFEEYHCYVWSVAFSPDGTLLATGSVYAHIWDLSSGKLVTTLKHYTRVLSIAFIPITFMMINY
jgi:WD40 repeat protein